MHGIARVRTTEEERIKKQKERAIKLKHYKACVEKVFQKRSQNEYDEEAMKLTYELLASNPDFSTIWNFRREMFLSNKENNVYSDEQFEEMLDAELQLTEMCLRVNPKSYYAWYQRIWALEKKANANWNSELFLCNKYLKFDERNFHCWDYRNYVVNKAKIDIKEEFNYTTKKIEENFSNYSAWHYRSKLLTKLFPDFSGVNSIEESKHRDELELVINAAFTDPNDTSAWFYQRWLLGVRKKDIKLAVCRISNNESFIAFNNSASLFDPNVKVNVRINQNEVVGNWKSLSSLKYDVLWVLKHDTSIDIKESDEVKVIFKYGDNLEETVVCKQVESNFIGYANVSFSNNFGKSVINELKEQQKSCEQLLELEPDSKWTFLTLTVILNAIDPISNYEECKKIFDQLSVLDSKRINYYKDLCARWHLEYCLERDQSILEKGKFVLESQNNKDIELPVMYHLQYWSACKKIDARSLKLTSRVLPSLYVLQNCQILDIGNNVIETLKGFPSLSELHTIYLDGNNIEIKELKYLENCEKLENVYLSKPTVSCDWKPSFKNVNFLT